MRIAAAWLVLVCALHPLLANESGEAARATGDPAQDEARAESPAATEQPGRFGLYALDILVPGSGALRQRRPGWAATFALGRVATAWICYEAYVSMVEYRSAERAARYALAVYGPGLRFPDPYSNAFRTADEFQRLADRRAAIMSGAGTLHLFLTGLSLLMTHAFYEDTRDTNTPVFTIGMEATDGWNITAGDGAGMGLKFDAGLVMRY